jgi:hypothetical protein
MAKKLYVGNLPWGTKRETLESAINSQIEAAVKELKEAGKDVEATIEDNFFKVDERGNARFSIVTISNDEVAEKVIELMNMDKGTDRDGNEVSGFMFDAEDNRGPRLLTVNEARPKEDRPRDDRRGGYGGGRRDFRPRRDFGGNDYNQE